jgi:hypothetical protein
MRAFLATAALCAATMSAAPGQAARFDWPNWAVSYRPSWSHHWRAHGVVHVDARHPVRWSQHWRAHRATAVYQPSARHYVGTDDRPAGAWCGWYMRHLLGVADRALNLAANWAHWGHPSAPRAGAVVVWPHHVGIIRGGPDASGRWLVESGNDGNAVRTRRRSLAGAIAFRM